MIPNSSLRLAASVADDLRKAADRDRRALGPSGEHPGAVERSPGRLARLAAFVRPARSARGTAAN